MHDKEFLLKKYLIFYESLERNDKETLVQSTIIKKYNKNSIFMNGDKECTGLIVLIKGRLRAYTVSDEGKEITLFRLFDGDTCILTASCMLKDIDFSISFCFEQDSEIIIIPKDIYEKLNEKYDKIKNYTLDLVSGRFSDVMWALEKYVFLGTAKMLANTIIEQSFIHNSNVIKITHEELARELGTAREVVTRLLKQFEGDNMVRLSRGYIEITDKKNLEKI